MNLLLINYEFPPIGGGAGNATHFLAKAMAKQGHDVTVLTGAWKEHRGTFHQDGFTLIRLPYRRQHPSMASPKEMSTFVGKAFLKLPKIVKSKRISHAIIFFTIPNGPLGWYLKTRFNIPYIVSLRGGDVPKLVPEIIKVHRILKPIRQTCLKKSHRIVANAQGLADLSMETDPYPVDVIPNGVDTTTFSSKTQKQKTEDLIQDDHSQDDHSQDEPTREKELFRIVFVGRFHLQKNLPLLLNTFHRMVLDDRLPPLHLHLVGQGPMEEQLFIQAEKLSLHEHLTWHGWTQKKDLIDIYQNAHLMVNPSFYEGLPNAVLEGMASGLPLVVSDVPGNRDLATEECGWTFPIEDEHLLEEALIKAIQMPREQLNTMGHAARARVMEHYDWNIVAKRYLDLFQGPKK